MAITRRTARFDELATAVEEILARQGMHADAALVDRRLNERHQYVAALLGVTPHTALRSAPDHLPQLIAAEIIGEGLARPVDGDVVDLDAYRAQRKGSSTSSS